MKETSVQISDSCGNVDKRCSRCRIVTTRFWKYCEAYGAIFAYYGSALGGLGSAVSVTVTNEYFNNFKSLDLDLKEDVSIPISLKWHGAGWVGFSSLWEQRSDASLGLSSAAIITRCSKCIPYVLRMQQKERYFFSIRKLFSCLTSCLLWE